MSCSLCRRARRTITPCSDGPRTPGCAIAPSVRPENQGLIHPCAINKTSRHFAFRILHIPGPNGSYLPRRILRHRTGCMHLATRLDRYSLGVNLRDAAKIGLCPPRSEISIRVEDSTRVENLLSHAPLVSLSWRSPLGQPMSRDHSAQHRVHALRVL